MDNSELENLDALIAEEKQIIAREYFTEAWEGAAADGIDADTVAETLIVGAFKALADEKGDRYMAKLLKRINRLDQTGDLTHKKTIQ